VPSNINRNVMMNRDAAPFGKRGLRRAVALTLDRKAFVDTLTEGKGDFGGAMLPPPKGVWGMPADMLKSLPGYNPDVAKNRAEARGMMEKLGYGPDKRLKLTVSTRNIAPYRDPAVILIDQLFSAPPRAVILPILRRPRFCGRWLGFVGDRKVPAGANSYKPEPEAGDCRRCPSPIRKY